MNRVLIPPKRQGETLLLSPWDFSPQMAAGEVINSASVAASVYTGVDAAPAAIISGVASFTTTVVSQKVTAGVVGVIYKLLCTAITNLGQTIQIAAFMTVVPDLP